MFTIISLHFTFLLSDVKLDPRYPYNVHSSFTTEAFHSIAHACCLQLQAWCSLSPCGAWGSCKHRCGWPGAARWWRTALCPGRPASPCLLSCLEAEGVHSCRIRPAGFGPCCPCQHTTLGEFLIMLYRYIWFLVLRPIIPSSLTKSRCSTAE